MAKFEFRKLGMVSKMSVTIVREDDEEEKEVHKGGGKLVSELKESLGEDAKIDSRYGGGIRSIGIEVDAADEDFAEDKISELREKYFPEG